MKLFFKINYLISLLTLLFIMPVITHAQFKPGLANEFSNSLQQAANTATFPSSQASENYIDIKLGTLITMAFVGINFMLMIIYSGIKWMTAGGNEEKVDKARKRIIGATIGFIIVLSAYIITTFVYNYLDSKFLTAPKGQTEQTPAQ